MLLLFRKCQVHRKSDSSSLSLLYTHEEDDEGDDGAAHGVDILGFQASIKASEAALGVHVVVLHSHHLEQGF